MHLYASIITSIHDPISIFVILVFQLVISSSSTPVCLHNYHSVDRYENFFKKKIVLTLRSWMNRKLVLIGLMNLIRGSQLTRHLCHGNCANTSFAVQSFMLDSGYKLRRGFCFNNYCGKKLVEYILRANLEMYCYSSVSECGCRFSYRYDCIMNVLQNREEGVCVSVRCLNNE